MKRFFCILFLIIILCSLCSCKDNVLPDAVETDISNDQKDNALPDAGETNITNDQKDNALPNTMKTNISKDHVAEFMELLGAEIELGGLSSGFVLDEEHCYNVTPPQVAAETDMQIFKFSDSCFSCVVLDNRIYELCTSFGGYGFVNAVPCDFDNDGNKDLLVASSWGSGIHRSIISVFNSVSKESTVLYSTLGTDTPDIDLFVATVTPSYSSKEIENLPIYYQVYSAEITVNNMVEYNLADLSYVATDLVGSIEIEDGTPTFKPYQK